MSQLRLLRRRSRRELLASGVWNLLLGAIALLLVIEGLLPFLSPRKWRAVLERITQMNDGQIRFMGMSSVLAGIALLYFFWA